ncbi:MAG: hypothetical protein IKZ81_06870 [Clostridia bacterium]|nr:hypothetical protein [Clostridia bacterium]
MLSALAACAAVVWGIKGETYLSDGGFLARIAEALDFGDYGGTLGVFIMDAVSFFALGFLLLASASCMRGELKEGTPFTEKGADRMRRLGFIIFFVSLATEMAAVIIRETFSAPAAESLGIVGGMATGLALIIMTPVIRYGVILQDMLMLNDLTPQEIEILETPPLYENGEPEPQPEETPEPEEVVPPEAEEMKTE